MQQTARILSIHEIPHEKCNRMIFEIVIISGGPFIPSLAFNSELRTDTGLPRGNVVIYPNARITANVKHNMAVVFVLYL